MMRISILAFLLFSAVSFCSAQSTQVDLNDNPAVATYFGDLTYSWATIGPRRIFTNPANNILVLKKTNQQSMTVNVPSGVVSLLTQHPNAKAIKSANQWYVVGQNGNLIE